MWVDFQNSIPLMLLIALIFGVLGLTTTLAVVPLIIRRLAPFVANRRELHQTHLVAVPRLGGIGLAAAFVLIVAASFAVDDPRPGHPRLVLGFTSLAMFALGLWDDLSPLGAKKKLLGQILIALTAFYLGMRVDTFRNPLNGITYQLGMWSVVATVFWLVALTNLINLLDGIDGLATGIGLMLMGLLVYVSYEGQLFSLCISTGMVGVLLAFLFFNFPPAKIYLGDGGAYFLGYLIGGLAIQNSNKGTIAAALIAPIFALALPILDVLFSITRRAVQGLPIFRADRGHIHHRLLKAGYSRRRAVLLLYGVSLIFLALAFVAYWSEGRLTPILVGCAFVVLIVAVPSLGLIKSWLAIGAAVGRSLESRKEIQYALLLRKWLEMEAERGESLDALWQELTFMADKLGFTSLTMTHRETCRVWTAASSETEAAGAGPFPLIDRHELQIGGETVRLELEGSQKTGEKKFQLLGELVAETWLHAARRWTRRNRATFVLPDASASESDARHVVGIPRPAIIDL